MNENHQCSETTRNFPTAQAARASERRFLEIQSACAASQIPELRQGDVIYIDTELYISHGQDDFRGGLAEVIECSVKTSAGKPTPFIRVAQQLDTWHNWRELASMQKKLRVEFGKNWAHPDPDERAEFNEG
ncbi:MAG TPA: hypothetical protein VGK22_16905 [Candidatus Angelobacter sp.]|jgi:hypothetical protein